MSSGHLRFDGTVVEVTATGILEGGTMPVTLGTRGHFAAATGNAFEIPLQVKGRIWGDSAEAFTTSLTLVGDNHWRYVRATPLP